MSLVVFEVYSYAPTAHVACICLCVGMYTGTLTGVLCLRCRSTSTPWRWLSGRQVGAGRMGVGVLAPKRRCWVHGSLSHLPRACAHPILACPGRAERDGKPRFSPGGQSHAWHSCGLTRLGVWHCVAARLGWQCTGHAAGLLMLAWWPCLLGI